MRPDRKGPVLVIGCGSIGRRHLANLRHQGVADVVVYDEDLSRAEEAAALGGRAVASIDEAWALAPAVVFVATPPHRHVAFALEAARRHAHLFIEKPLADGLDGVDALVDACLGVVSMVACNMRFHPGPRRIKDLIDSGAIGTPLTARLATASYLPDWRPGTDYRASYSASRAMGGGAILDCIHEIDLALWYFGDGRLASAAAVDASSIGLDVEGAAEILIRHAPGTLSSVHLSVIRRDYHRSCEVVGTDGSIRWTFDRPEVILCTPSGTSTLALDPAWEVNEMYQAQATYFLDCVERGLPSMNTVADARDTLRLALDARDRAVNGAPA